MNENVARKQNLEAIGNKAETNATDRRALGQSLSMEK
jgi:hypothetical protein